MLGTFGSTLLRKNNREIRGFVVGDLVVVVELRQVVAEWDYFFELV